ncbi:MAG: NAD(P)/FAD-dependent oxidoreductase [Actinomycetes bacterium]
MTTTPSSAIVVGAGIIGSSIALELSRRGWDVTVVDKGSTPGCGSTSASSAMVRFNYDNLQEVVLAWESYARWVDWSKHLGTEDPAGMATYVKTGLLVLDGELLDRTLELGHMDALGIPYEAVTAEQIRERYPALDPARIGPACRVEDEHFWDDPTGEVGGFIEHESGFVNDATLAAHNLAFAAEQFGATFRWRSVVVDVLRDAGRVRGIKLEDGTELMASVVVNAAGPWSVALNTMAGVLDDFSTSTKATEQEVISVPAPEGFDIENGGTGVHDPDFGTYFRPHPGGTIIVGSFEAPCDPLILVDDADDIRQSPSATNWEVQSLRLARRLPGLQIPSQKSGVVSAYDITDDWIPIYDKTNLDGYYVAIGTSGHQFKAAPFVGVAMAELIGAVESGRDHDIDPVVVKGEYTGVDLELAFFSRRRETQLHRQLTHSL